MLGIGNPRRSKAAPRISISERGGEPRNVQFVPCPWAAPAARGAPRDERRSAWDRISNPYGRRKAHSILRARRERDDLGRRRRVVEEEREARGAGARGPVRRARRAPGRERALRRVAPPGRRRGA